MPNPFTYPAFDLVTMSPLDALPYQGVSFGEVLNQPGPWTGQLPLADPRIQELGWERASREGCTALFVDLGGELVWGGIIWTRQYQESAKGKPIKVGATEFGSYFKQRLQAADYTIPNPAAIYWNANPADPMVIAQQMIMDAQAGAITFTPVQTTSAASGTGTVTSLSVTALTAALPLGAKFTIAGDTNAPVIVWTVTTAAPIGAVTVAVTASVSVTTTIAAGNILVGNAPTANPYAIGGNGLNGTNLGITVVLNGSTPTGDWISPTYPGTQLQTIDSIINTLSQMGYQLGPDYSFDCQYLPGTKIPAITMNFWTPRKGQLAAQSGIVVLKSDMVDFTYDEDSTPQALGISETASGTGGLSPAYVSVPTMGYPPLEKTISRTQVNNEGVLVTLADADLDLYANPVILPTITVPLALPDSQGGTDPTQIGFANFNLGDDLLWRIDPLSGGGLNVSPRFPNGMSFEWRIVKWLCQVPDSGLPVLVFTLALPPTTVSPPPAPPLA
jgi:hypothetical protein